MPTYLPTGDMASKTPPLPAAPAAPRYNREQWIESFEGQLAILRPHLTPRPLAAISLQMWHKHGRHDADPIACARAWTTTT